MSKIYATSDREGRYGIREDAEILAFDSKDQAIEHLSKEFGNDYSPERFELEELEFLDCWQKRYTEDIDLESFSPFAEDDLDIYPPGSHPGRKCFWVIPRPPIYGLVEIFEDEE